MDPGFGRGVESSMLRDTGYGVFCGRDQVDSNRVQTAIGTEISKGPGSTRQLRLGAGPHGLRSEYGVPPEEPNGHVGSLDLLQASVCI